MKYIPDRSCRASQSIPSQFFGNVTSAATTTQIHLPTAKAHEEGTTLLKAGANRLNVVPVLNGTLDILEFLAGTDTPLKMNDIAIATGVSPTTTYRILQTLIHRGYITHDCEGKYGLANLPEVKAAFGKHAKATHNDAYA